MKLLILLAAFFAFAFFSLMLINDDTPSKAWGKIQGWTMQQLHLKKIDTPTEIVPTPTPPPTSGQPTPSTSEPDQIPTPTPSSEPPSTNPIAWFTEYSKVHEQEITIKQPVSFPALYEGKVVGSVKKPAGTVVKIIEIHPPNVTVSFNGGISDIPIEITDLLEKATLELEKSTVGNANAPVTNGTPNTAIDSTKESEFNVLAYLEKPVLESKEVFECFLKNPSQTFEYLHSKVVKINGIVQKIQILGLDEDKVEITLVSNKNKRLVLRLKLENIIDKSKIESGVINKLVLEDGKLKLISQLVHGSGRYYYYYWNGYQYVRNYYYGNYYDGYGYRHYGNYKDLESPICSEGADISNWSGRLSSTNAASIYFDLIKL